MLSDREEPSLTMSNAIKAIVVHFHILHCALTSLRASSLVSAKLDFDLEWLVHRLLVIVVGRHFLLYNQTTT